MSSQGKGTLPVKMFEKQQKEAEIIAEFKDLCALLNQAVKIKCSKTGSFLLGKED